MSSELAQGLLPLCSSSPDLVLLFPWILLLPTREGQSEVVVTKAMGRHGGFCRQSEVVVPRRWGGSVALRPPSLAHELELRICRRVCAVACTVSGLTLSLGKFNIFTKGTMVVILLLLAATFPANSQFIQYMKNLSPNALGRCCHATGPNCYFNISCVVPLKALNCAALLDDDYFSSSMCGSGAQARFAYASDGNTNMTLSFGFGGEKCDENPSAWPSSCSGDAGSGFSGALVGQLFGNPGSCISADVASPILDKICSKFEGKGFTRLGKGKGRRFACSPHRGTGQTPVSQRNTFFKAENCWIQEDNHSPHYAHPTHHTHYTHYTHCSLTTLTTHTPLTHHSHVAHVHIHIQMRIPHSTPKPVQTTDFVHTLVADELWDVLHFLWESWDSNYTFFEKTNLVIFEKTNLVKPESKIFWKT